MGELLNKPKNIPKSPGVYFLKNSKGKIIYIGKAGNLKNRIQSYFQPYTGYSGLRANLEREIADISYKETGSEIEALILESQLIKKYKPKYNIMLRDDKNYFFVGITREGFPRIFITHQPKTSYKAIKLYSYKASYIGPFTGGRSLKEVLRILRKVFPYYIARRHPKIKCACCHLGLCPGPNPDIKEYKRSIRAIKDILKGKRLDLVKKLEKEMKTEAKKENFEKAAQIRNQIESLQNIFQHSKLIFGSLTSQNLNFEKLSIIDDRQLLTIKNLTRNLRKYLSINLKQKKSIRIEGYDISNIQGKYATGSMVVFDNNTQNHTKKNTKQHKYIGPNKNEYRKFKIKTVRGISDVDMMKEVLKRRLRHTEWPMPDLILIDGGKAQLNAVLGILTKRGQSPLAGTIPTVISLAKKKEEVYVRERKKPIRLAKNNPLRLLLMRIRDEAHRFAISYHRGLYQKEYKKIE